VDQNPDRSTWYFVLGIAAILAGTGLFVYFLVNGIFHVTDNLTQVIVPGEADLSLEGNVKYTVFLEQESVVNGRIFAIHDHLDGLACRLREQAAGTEVTFQRTQTNLTYNVNGRSGRSILEFTPQTKGVYHITCGYGEQKEGPQAVLAIGSGFGEKIVSLLSRCFASMFGGGIVGAAFLIYAFRLHKRMKLQNNSGQQPSPQPFL
jgi:hypothetical protein